LWGNHEVMNALGIFHYTHNKDVEYEYYFGTPFDTLVSSFGPNNIRTWRRQFAGNQPVRWAVCEPGGWLAHSLWAQLSVALVVGRTLCVHAGLTTTHLDMYRSTDDNEETKEEESVSVSSSPVANMNAAARQWITTVHHGHNWNHIPSHVEPKHIVQFATARAQAASRTLPACLGGSTITTTTTTDTTENADEAEAAASPVWMRDFAQTPPQQTTTEAAMIKARLHAVLQQTKTHRMVMGHTPQEYITAGWEGCAWRIDTGVSRGMGSGPPEVLEILHGGEMEQDQVYIITSNGDRIPAVERYE
jgi:hypothetical protein